MKSAEKLAELFREFPGIGPRQAKRFIYFLLNKNPSFIKQLKDALLELKEEMRVCQNCHRFFPREVSVTNSCSICKSKNRDTSILLVVPRDIDLETIEKSGTYNGLYFVLGGTVPILEKNPELKIKINELKSKIAQSINIGEPKIVEIILGTSLNPEGENTAFFIQSEIKNIAGAETIKISHLGRGLSTGTELEYSDSLTLKNALENRR